VQAGEADHLVPERVWQELSRGLMERTPSRMVMVLRECGALARALPQLDEWYSASVAPERMASRLDEAAARGYSLPVRYALLLLDLEPAKAEALSARVNAPGDCRELAAAAIRETGQLQEATLDAEATLSLLERSDAFRRPERLERLLEVAHCDAHSHAGDRRVPERELRRALEAARKVDGAALAREHPGDIPGAIRRARLTAIAGLQAPTGH
jgi:tRNA nucleotidyltransferase (CCA-adding enzyme)